MVVRTYVIPLLAVAGVGMAVYTVRSEGRSAPPAPPVAAPATSPYSSAVAGAGIVESSTQNIAIGTHVPGVVMTVHVTHGQMVSKGDPLFTIDDRAARAALAVEQAALRTAQASLVRLEALPRAEDVPPAEARVREMNAMLDDLKTQLAMMEAVTDKRAIVQEELTRRRNAVATAETRLAEASAQLALLKAGAWDPDEEVARAQVAAARARADAAQVDLDRLTVKAPVDGQVLQLNIRAGEFAQAGPLSTPLIMLGGVKTLHVRVDVDENDAWRVKADSKASASLRGNSSLRTPLRFVRIDPYVVPKRSLTGESTERVDTRVLQVVYAFDRADFPVYVGQQMDVYIDAPALTPALSPAPQPAPPAN